MITGTTCHRVVYRRSCFPANAPPCRLPLCRKLAGRQRGPLGGAIKFTRVDRPDRVVTINYRRIGSIVLREHRMLAGFMVEWCGVSTERPPYTMSRALAEIKGLRDTGHVWNGLDVMNSWLLKC